MYWNVQVKKLKFVKKLKKWIKITVTDIYVHSLVELRIKKMKCITREKQTFLWNFEKNILHSNLRNLTTKYWNFSNTVLLMTVETRSCWHSLCDWFKPKVYHTLVQIKVICFITEIKVTNEDKLAGNRNFRKHSRKSFNVRELAPRCIHHGARFITPRQILFPAMVAQTASQFSWAQKEEIPRTIKDWEQMTLNIKGFLETCVIGLESLVWWKCIP